MKSMRNLWVWSSLRWGALALALVAALAACTSQPTILPSRDLDRPTDLTFVCMGAFGAATDGGAASGDAAAGSGLVVSGRPMRDCHARNMPDPAPDAQHRTFGFMPNSANGLLTVVDADSWKLVDLDLTIAGFNQYPLGRLPTQIVASDDGCRLFTANRGSCDLTMVDPALLMQPTLALEIPGLPAQAPGELGKTIRPKFGAQELRLIPQEIALLPRDTSSLTGGENLCPGSDDWHGQAIVTFPSCNLIALLDLPTGQIVDGLYVRRTSNGRVATEPLNGRAPQCPVDDCQAGDEPAGGPMPADAGATDATSAADADDDAGAGDAGGAAPTDGPRVLDVQAPRPGPIAIVPGGARAYVGLVDAPFILALDLTSKPNALVPARAAPDDGVIALAGGAVGTTRLRLSIDPYADKPTAMGYSGKFVGGAIDVTHLDRQYLYAIARDGTVRVVQVAVDPETECETNADQSKYTPDELTKACLPVDSTRRRAGAQGPGIRLGAPPIDIAAADVASSLTSADHSETSVAGAHAWVLGANGTVYLVNIDPVERFIRYVPPDGLSLMCSDGQTMCASEPPPVPNTVRNRNFMSYLPTLGPSDGPPRLDFLTSQPTTGPRIESIWTLGSADNATSDTSASPAPYIQTQVFFPQTQVRVPRSDVAYFADPTGTIPQSWTVAWEGPILGTPRASGQVNIEGSGFVLYDPGMDFCRQGMRALDLVSLTGCTTDAQCGMGNVCLKGTEGTIGAGNVPITGLCTKKGTLQATCEPLISTVRRYEVTAANQTLLGIRPRMDELIRPELDPCVVPPPVTTPGATDAGAPADSDAGTDGGAPPPNKCFNPNDPGTTGFTCVAYKRPEATTAENRCLMQCTTVGSTDQCRAGRVCVSFAENPADRVDHLLEDGKTLRPACSGPNECFCADGPDLAIAPGKECFDQLLPYQLHVGRGFLVQGAQTGNQATREATPGTGVCRDIAGLDVRTVMRIPMSAPRCTNLQYPDSELELLDSRCNPDLRFSTCVAGHEGDAAKLRSIARTDGAPNPCLFWGGPNETDAQGASPTHVHALFRNDQVRFLMTNLDQPISGVYQMKFDVHGGFRAQTVYNPPTVEVGMPARIVLGPFDAQAPSATNPNQADVPYLFVVDQLRLGRTAGGGRTRGQLLRIQPRGQAITSPTAGSQPWFEDFTRSGELFPIQ